MVFDDKLGKYVDEYDGLVFTWENPDEDRTEDEKRISENYYSHIDDIAEFMLPDLIEFYGDVTIEEVKEKLGKPLIDYDNGTVTYLEQSFDGAHIFELEFLDDEFNDLQYFSVDG